MTQIDQCGFDIICIDKDNKSLIKVPNDLSIILFLTSNISFHTSWVRLKRKYLFRSRKKEILLHSTKAGMLCTMQQNGNQSESTTETSGCV